MTTPSEDVGLIERLRSTVSVEPVDPKAVYRTRPVALFEQAAASLAAKDEEIVRTKALLDRLVGAMAPFMPIMFRETPHYCELTFGEHRTQAMTVAPDDWTALSLAYSAASRQALQGDADVSR